MDIWMKVTKDKYEFPVAIADSSEELGRIVGVKASTIRSAVCGLKDGTRKRSQYRKVVVEEETR